MKSREMTIEEFIVLRTERRQLQQLFWECTLRCNLNCQHCGSDCRKDNMPKDMPFADTTIRQPTLSWCLFLFPFNGNAPVLIGEQKDKHDFYDKHACRQDIGWEGEAHDKGKQGYHDG